MKREFNSLIKSLLRSTGGGNLKRQTKTVKSSDRLSQGLRLMTILILLGTMPVSSVYAQCEHNNYENGFCQTEGCTSTYQEPTKDDNGVYQIANAGNLYWFADYVRAGSTSANAKLTADITVNAGYTINADGTVTKETETYYAYNLPEDFKKWTPIGSYDSQANKSYQGIFDGQGHTISGLYYKNTIQTSGNYVGLFGYAKECTIRNLGVIDSYFNGSSMVGGIVGYNVAGTVSNCYNTASINGMSRVSGIVGRNAGKVLNCYNTASINGQSTVSGIVGSNEGSVTNCYNSGYISGTQRVSGIVGYNEGSVSNCYNKGSISGDTYVGGIAGENNNTGTISKCYYLEGTAAKGIGNGEDEEDKTESRIYAEFASGEVAYLLQYTQGTQVWGQNIDNGQERQNYPVLSNARVYTTTCCGNSAYSNTNETYEEHSFDNGFCTRCDAYEPATPVDGVYQIANAGNLYWFAEQVNGGNNNISAKLTANIVVNENVLVNGELNTDTEIVSTFREWTPIGNSTNSYLGSFDGQGHTVSGLYYDAENIDYVGLFGHIGYHNTITEEILAVINNVGVIDSYFKIIKSNKSDNEEKGSYIAGIVGRVGCGRITNCYNTSYIDGFQYVGGIVGLLDRGSILNCYSTGSVNVSSHYAGGIVGYTSKSNYHTNQILNCYSTGSISGYANKGGIAGFIGEVTVSNCYYLKVENGTNSGIYGIGYPKGDGNTAPKTTTQFASGEVAWLLQNAQTSQEPTVWGQNIDNNQTNQGYPVLNGVKVYKICNNDSYSNTKPGDNVHSGLYNDNGFCTHCGAYEPATLDNGVYQIANVGNLYWFAEHVNSGGDNASANAKLTADINVNAGYTINADGTVTKDNTEYTYGSFPNDFKTWTPIGNSSTIYSGTFDGDNHTISGLYYNDQDGTYVGLFGNARENSIIQNVGIKNSYFKANKYIGGVVGYFAGQSVTNCYNEGTIEGYHSDNGSSQLNVGGVLGMGIPKGQISNCYNKGIIKASSQSTAIGGVVGNFSGIISNCYNTGSISGTADLQIGGVVGYFYSGTMSNCYNTGTITNEYDQNSPALSGGVVAYKNVGTISNCYNTGSIEGSAKYSGGIVANNSGGTISNCYNTGAVTKKSVSVGGVVAMHSSGSGTISNSYYLYGTASYGIGDSNVSQGGNVNQEGTAYKTDEEFASGEVAFLLQNGVPAPSENEPAPQVWGQNIDNGQTPQNYPVFSDARVYRFANEGSYTYTNKIGGNVLWSYEDNTLTIHGSGNMRGFEANETKPWSNYLSEINTVVVKAGITGIGDNAFSDIENLTSLFYYKSAQPASWGENWINSGSTVTVYVPATDSWSGFSVGDCNVQSMPTYTSGTWQMPTKSKSTEPTSTDHVVINDALVLSGQQSKSNSQSLTVSSFGLTESGSITIKAGEQKVNDELIDYGGQLICQQANGEVTVEKTIYSPNWYTISSPLKGNVSASSVNSLIPDDANTYALYRYDEPTHYWQNYKYQDNNFTTLDAGRGYLYARSSSDVTTLQFTGEINTEPVQYALTVDGDALQGFHLIGNPFTHEISASANFQLVNATLAEGYYVLSNQGSWLTYLANTGIIKPGQGALIKTSTAGTLTISPTEPADETEGEKSRAKSQEPMLALNVTNGNYSDRAFVIFGKGIGLDKINHQNEEIPMLYIPMSDADYAIAMMDESVNEIPVGFESSSMGQFTITLKQENCEFEELYLLDKETGAKVNILEQDYTFMTTSGDNAERFTLIMAQGSQPEAQSNFAYINNGDVVIYGAEGNAQIDIYDVLGRRVYNNNGSDDVHIVNTDGYSAGVYVIRLMDEKGVRTQKVIID